MDPKNRSVQEHSASLYSPYNLALSGLALGMGLLIGWLDLQVTEVFITILALLTAGFLLGLFQPVAAWRLAILIVIGLPIMESIALTGNWQTAEPVRVDIRITLVALAFALLGTYIGVFIRFSLRTLTSRSSRRPG